MKFFKDVDIRYIGTLKKVKKIKTKDLIAIGTFALVPGTLFALPIYLYMRAKKAKASEPENVETMKES